MNLQPTDYKSVALPLRHTSEYRLHRVPSGNWSVPASLLPESERETNGTNVSVHTEAACEEKLARLIAEIAAEKKRRKQAELAG